MVVPNIYSIATGIFASCVNMIFRRRHFEKNIIDRFLKVVCT
jgi:hypothetical protein